MAAAPVTQFRLGEFLVGAGVGGPQLEHAVEIGFCIGKLRVCGVGLLARVGGAFAGILDAQEGDEDHQLVRDTEPLRFDQHARQRDIDRQAGDGRTDPGHAVLLVDGANLDQASITIANRALGWRFDKREIGDIAKLEAQHAQDDPGQRSAQDFRIGVARAPGVIVFGVQAIADAGGDTSAAALALVGGGLRDGLDVQSLKLATLAVAFHPRRAGIDDEADARHGQRRLGDIGRQHDAPLRPGFEHAILLAGGEPRIQGKHFGFAVLAPIEGKVRIADLALSGQEDQHIATRILGGDFVNGRDDLGNGVRVIFPCACCDQSIIARGKMTLTPVPPAHLDREGPSFDFKHRRVVEMCGEARRVDGRRGHDELEVAAIGKQALEVTEQEIDIEAALVGLVENDRVVGTEPGIALGLGEQDAVGHELDQGGVANLFGEAHLETDQITDRRTQLAGNAACDRARGNPARLRAADHAGRAAPGGEAEFRQLRGLARAGFAGQHDDLVFADQRDDLVTALGDRQRFVNADFRHARRACGNFRRRCRDLGGELFDMLDACRRRVPLQPPQATNQAATIAGRDACQCGFQF